ncbi:MAG TPA: polysaccharide biosynthesis C-terminal domain-containing protein [Cytophagaceae bacterium]|nr:polysaccharide biosynthesis C-terminal domain-containing protein [Cytophagaceae bacterium]
MNSNIKSSIATKLIVAGINFLLVILSVRYLGASGRGEISFFITVLATIQLFSEIVNGPTIIYLSTRLSIKNQLAICFLWSLTISVVSYFIGEFLRLEDSLLLAICSLQFSLSSTCLMLLQGNHRIKLYNILSLVQSFILLSLFTFLVLKVDKDYHSFIYAFFFSWNIPFIISLLIIATTLLKHEKKSENFAAAFKQMFRKGIESQSGNVVSFLNYRLLFYIIVFIDPGKTMLGVVSTGFAIAESILIISNGLSTIQYPAIAKKATIDEAKIITANYLIICFWFSIIGLITLNLIPSGLYTFIFGKDFNSIKTILLIISPGILFLNMQNTICQYFNGLGLYIINTIGSVIGLASLVFFSILGYSCGIYGLCVAVSLSYAILCFYMLYRFIKHSNLSFTEGLSYFKDSKKIIMKTLFS